MITLSLWSSGGYDSVKHVLKLEQQSVMMKLVVAQVDSIVVRPV